MPKQTTIKLARVQYIPKYPEPGILYVSEEFEAAVQEEFKALPAPAAS